MENINYIEKTGKVIYRSKMQKGGKQEEFTCCSQNNRLLSRRVHCRYYSVYSNEVFSDYSLLWNYSNKSRGMRGKAETLSADIDNEMIPDEVEVIDVSRISAKASL